MAKVLTDGAPGQVVSGITTIPIMFLLFQEPPIKLISILLKILKKAPGR